LDIPLNPLSIFRILVSLLCLLPAWPAHAHHVLGRPAYSLNEDSNTPPSMQVETQIGDYMVNMMVFPAFPKPGEQGRLHMYAALLDNSQEYQSYQGKVTFKVRDDGWFASAAEVLGTQEIDDKVYRQGFVFSKAGNYIVTAEFQADGQSYIIDMPLRVGEPTRLMPIGVAAGAIIFVLVGVRAVQRRRRTHPKAKRPHEAARGEA